MTPEQLAGWIESSSWTGHSAHEHGQLRAIAAELRRLAAENERLRKVLTKANSAMHADACYWHEVAKTSGQTEVTIDLPGPLADLFAAAIAASNELRTAVNEAMKETP